MSLPTRPLVAYLALGLALRASVGLAQDTPSVAPLAQAHAHNDYLHERPLFDALEHGFTSVEADVFLVDGELLVAHERSQLNPERTLRSLYLDPLKKLAAAHAGRIWPDGPTLTLLVDIKADGEAAYRALDKLLADYDDLVSSARDGRWQTGAVTVIVSGDRAWKNIAAEPVRRVGLDGRLSDLDSDLPANLLPLISDNWNNHFRWRGNGTLPEAERDKLLDVVERAHARGRRVRFWATPDTPAMWGELAAAEVDLINTDHLAELAQFLRKRQETSDEHR